MSKVRGGENHEAIVKFYRALGHDVRRRILEYLAEKGRVSFKELREDLKISVGSLYHSLDIMGEFVTQDEDRKYVLTERGRLAYELMVRDRERLNALRGTEGILGRCMRIYLRPALLPYEVVSLLLHSRPISIAILLMVITSGSLLSSISGLRLLLLHFDIFPELQHELLASHFILSLALIFLLVELLSLSMGIGRSDALKLASGISLSMIPLTLVPPIYLLLGGECVLLSELGYRLYSIVNVLMQMFSLCLLSASVKVVKKVGIERAFAISFSVFVLSLLLSIALGP